MYKLVKWVYKLGYNRAKDEVLKLIEKEVAFHSSQAEIKSLQKQDKLYDDLFVKDRKVLPEHHEQRRIALTDLQNAIDPERYPNIDKFLEMLK